MTPVPSAAYVAKVTAFTARGAVLPLVNPVAVHTMSSLPIDCTSVLNDKTSVRCSSQKFHDAVIANVPVEMDGALRLEQLGEVNITVLVATNIIP